MSLDFQAALNRKYNILGEQANAQSNLANAQAGETETRTLTIPGLARSQIGLQGAQSGLYGAQAGYTNAETEEVHPNAVSHRSLESHQGALYDAQGNLANAQAQGVQGLNHVEYGFARGTPAVPGGGFGGAFGIRGNYAQGTDRVPGKPTPGVDSVAAKLSPNEAVLNEGGADTLGRGLIDFLNAIGNIKMGMGGGQPAEEAAEGESPQGYAKGTSKVMPKKPAGKDDAAQSNALMALLQSMGGGGQPMAPAPGGPMAAPPMMPPGAGYR